MKQKPMQCESIEVVVDEIIRRVGPDLRLGLPLGLGKPVGLVNALYRRVKADPGLKLTILTALSLQIPSEKDPVRGRLLQPVFDRLFSECEDLDYVLDLSSGTVPDNIQIKEFYFLPGSRLGNAHSQQHYVYSNYTHAARDVVAAGCNVAVQWVAKRVDEQGRVALSMSCNPDTTPEVIERLNASGRDFVTVAVVNERLPFMLGDAETTADKYDMFLDNSAAESGLFATPKLLPVGDADYLIGLHASTLVPDGGTLQVGIGSLGDAIVYGLILRHQQNASYQKALDALGISGETRELIAHAGGTQPFSVGLYGATEMFVEGFLHLLEADILKREVYDFWALQQLINQGICDPASLNGSIFEEMAELGVRELRGKDFDILQHHGLFNAETRYERGHIIAPDGQRIEANVADPESQRVMAEQCLGSQLRNGHVLHGGFFLGSRDFYRALVELDEEQRRKICMAGVYKINQLDHNPRLFKAQRKDARFINSGMMVTLNGAVASDTLDSGQVVSGVGGQYNFVAMAHQLLTGRSVLMVRAVRQSKGQTVSNIVMNYGSCTIPRHLRDIVVTEYGIADLRSKSDSDVAKALLNIADSRFQEGLLQRAKQDGKVESDYQIPAEFRNNTPESLTQTLAELRREGYFPPYPFGCDFTDEELTLARALKAVAARKEQGFSKLLPALLSSTSASPEQQALLERMGLENPEGLRDKMLRKLLVAELNQQKA